MYQEGKVKKGRYRRKEMKHVTWSPVVKNVSRPGSRKRVKRAETTFILKKNGKSHNRVTGQVNAHFRKNTKSLLLTVRNHVHRDIQFLIDLSTQKLRRIYDGERSWNVTGNGANMMTVKTRFGTIFWKDDRLMRPANASGFRLDWLEDMSVAVEPSRKISKRVSRRRAKKS